MKRVHFKCKKCGERRSEFVDIDDVEDDTIDIEVTCKCGTDLVVTCSVEVVVEVEDVEIVEPDQPEPIPGEISACPDCDFPVRAEEDRWKHIQFSDAEGPRERLTHVCVLTEIALRQEQGRAAA